MLYIWFNSPFWFILLWCSGMGVRRWSHAYLGPWCFLHILASYRMAQRDANPVCAEWRHTHVSITLSFLLKHGQDVQNQKQGQSAAPSLTLRDYAELCKLWYMFKRQDNASFGLLYSKMYLLRRVFQKNCSWWISYKKKLYRPKHIGMLKYLRSLAGKKQL